MSPRIAEAVARLAAGEVVAFPTETVYGLGADATNDAAIAKIFALKGRPATIRSSCTSSGPRISTPGRGMFPLARARSPRASGPGRSR